MSLIVNAEKKKLVIQLNQLSKKLKSFYIDQKKYEKLIEIENKKKSDEKEMDEQIESDELNIVKTYINYR